LSASARTSESEVRAEHVHGCRTVIDATSITGPTIGRSLHRGVATAHSGPPYVTLIGTNTVRLLLTPDWKPPPGITEIVLELPGPAGTGSLLRDAR
jgi:hypothetical protein